jgi:hypothetical protein
VATEVTVGSGLGSSTFESAVSDLLFVIFVCFCAKPKGERRHSGFREAADTSGNVVSRENPWRGGAGDAQAGSRQRSPPNQCLGVKLFSGELTYNIKGR